MDNTESGLLERIERLERVVDGLLARDPKARAALEAGRRAHGEDAETAPSMVPRRPTPVVSSAAEDPLAPTSRPAPATTRASSPSRSITTAPVDTRSVLRVVGIALLLFGVAFLFKYSEGESDLLRSVRVLIGIALGIGLAIGGRVLLTRDRPFAQILTGGGIAIWFMAGFAAYQLFGLIGAVPGFVYMAVVTVAAFIISIRQNSLPLTIVATLGGLATPFLLNEPTRGVWGVALYVVAVAATAVAIHRNRGWWGLLWVATGTSLYALSFHAEYYFNNMTPDAERWVLQGGTLALFVLFAWTSAKSYARGVRAAASADAHDTRLLLVTLIPVCVVGVTHTIWHLSKDLFGEVCVTAALIYMALTVLTYARNELKRLTNAYILLASGFAAVGALALIDGEMQHLAIATEALLLRILARRSTQLSITGFVSHALFVIAAFLTLRDLVVDPSPAVPLFNRTGITTLWSLVAGTIAALSIARGERARRIYLYVAHTLLLAWILRQFSEVGSGQAIITIIWGLYGAALVVEGLRRKIRAMRTVGLLTLFAVVAKLFVVDLASVRAIWRVLLFIGFGGVFLALSYWFLTLDRGAAQKK